MATGTVKQILIDIKTAFNNRGVHEARRSVDRLNESFKKNESRFQAWSLSVMFAGMAIMRVMQQVWKSSTKTFQDISHSVEGTTTSFDMLNGQMKYLQFVAGEALAPLAEQLIPIAAFIAQWIQDNEQLFRGIVKWGFILGSSLMVIGQVVLAFNGLVTMVRNVGTAIDFLATKFFKYFPMMQSQVIRMAILWSSMGTAAKVSLLGSVAGIILALTWIFKLKDAMGGWGGFLKGLASGLIRVFAILGDVIVTALVTPLQWIVAAVAGLMGLGGMSTPKWMENFVKFKSTMTKDFLTYQQDSGFLENDQGWAQGGGLTPTFNITNLNITSDNVDDMMRQMNDMARNGG